jgi:hypothetical protein
MAIDTSDPTVIINNCLSTFGYVPVGTKLLEGLDAGSIQCFIRPVHRMHEISAQ